MKEEPRSAPRAAAVDGGRAESGGGAFEEMLLPILDDLWRFARRLETDDERAADLLQDALLVGWRKFHQLERPASLRAWMGRIVYRTFLNRVRRQAREVPLEELASGDEPASPALAPEERLLARRLRDELAAAVDTLPLAQRLAVLLVDALEFTYAEAAEALAVPPGTVASRVARGRSTWTSARIAANASIMPESSSTRWPSAPSTPASGSACSTRSPASGPVRVRGCARRSPRRRWWPRPVP